MLTEIYFEALLVNEDLANQVWEAWDKGEIDDAEACFAWWIIYTDDSTTQLWTETSLEQDKVTRSAIIGFVLLIIFPFKWVIAEDNVNVQLGKYSCLVKTAPGEDNLGTMYVGARLEYDADKGVLDLAMPLGGNDELLYLPPARICNRLSVQTFPSSQKNLHAVQFDPADESEFRPFVAWLMIETIDNEYTPNFKFFSTGIKGVVAGKCTHLP